MRVFRILIALALAACSGAAPGGPKPIDTSMRIGDAAMQAGMPDVALRVASADVGKNPRNATALAQEGDAYLTLGRNTEAEAAYTRALRIEPSNTRARIGLAMLLLQSDPAKAEDGFARVAAQAPGQAEALNGLGVARDLQGDHAKAQVAYRQALAIGTDSHSAQVNLGLSLALSGDGNAAIAILSPLAAEPQAERRVKDDLAVALAAAGRTEEARSILREEMSDDDSVRTVAAYRSLF
jgi:Flp pilus assembly protein TadD